MNDPCRTFLDRMADLLATAGGTGDLHTAECARCADLLAAARRHRDALVAMPRPELPDRLTSPGFLTEIHQRVVTESGLAEILEREITPVSAPELLEEAPWDDREDQRLVGPLRDLPRERAPGWLWVRIRTDLRGERIRLRRRRLVGTGLLAATLTLSAILAWSWVRAEKPTDEPEIVFVPVSQPLSDALSPASIVRRIVDGR